MTKKKAEKVEEEEIEEPLITFEIEKKILIPAFKAAAKFNKLGHKGILLETMRQGISLHAISSGEHCMVRVNIGKEHLKDYKYAGGLAMVLETQDIDDICTFAGLGKATTVAFTMDKEDILLVKGNLKRTIRWHPEKGDMRDGWASTIKFSKNLKKLGELPKIELESAVKYMTAAASFVGQSSKIIDIKSDGKEFILDTEIEGNDNLIMDLTKAMKKKLKDPVDMKFVADDISIMFSRAIKLNEKMILHGGSNQPIILTGHGTKPEDWSKFKHDLEYWFVLAPRVEE